MNAFDTEEELSDHELSQMLATWIVTVPSDELRARIFPDRRTATIWHTPSPPREIQSMWSKFADGRTRSFALALLAQACAVALMLVTFASPLIQKRLKMTDFILLDPYRPKLPTTANKSSGGGGQHSPTPATQGEAPKFARKTFIPPAMAISRPKLVEVPTITATAPQIDATNYGDPLSKLSGGSLGNGMGIGIGPGNGSGYGPGNGGNEGGGAYHIGGDVSAPTLISKVEPEYSEEARKAKYSGSVLLTVVVDENGIPRNIRVVRSLGLGLDEKAIQAVQRWRFKPGLRNGHPVPVQAAVEVSFRLL